MPDTTITITAECPDCESKFEADITSAALLDDSEEGITFECPDCGYEYMQAYTFDAATNIVTLGELFEDEEGDENDEEEEDEEGPDE